MENTTLPPQSHAAPVLPADDPPAGSGPRPEPGNCPPFTVTSNQLAFPRFPGETPRAYSAFMTFFHLGHNRSLQAVADKLGEGLPTVKNWSSRFNWRPRVHAFNSGLLQEQVQAEAALRRQRAADWAARLDHFREQEWDAAQKLLAAAQCFLESFGEEELHKMSLAQVSRALEISSTIGRLALAGADLPEPSEAPLAPVQQQLLEAVSRVYGQVAADSMQSPAPVPEEPPIATISIGCQNELPSTEVGSHRRGGRSQSELPPAEVGPPRRGGLGQSELPPAEVGPPRRGGLGQSELPPAEVGPPRRGGLGQRDDSLPGNDFGQSL